MLSLPRNILCILLAGSICINIAQGVPLLGGRYETTTDVQAFLNLALDTALMKETSDLDTKKDLYKHGSEGSDVTLRSLSVNAETTMADSPMYNLYRNAFLVLGKEDEGETQGLFDGASINRYADTLVGDLFALEIEDIQSEAAIVLNVWMAAVDELFRVLTECSAQDSAKGLQALDKVAALWIGEGQEEGSNEQGHLLYYVAENAGERFDQDEGETVVNTKIMDLLLSMQSDLNQDKCNGVDGYIAMREKVKQTLAAMTVPLVQNLIHHIMNVANEGGSDFVELYALATIPRVLACDPSIYEDELTLEVLRELTPVYQTQAIAATQKSFSCLGITCADVGSYMGGAVPQCEDPDGVTLVGYSTNRDGAREKSYLDRDVTQIGVFLSFEAYGAAMDWYKYGWNSVYTLQGLARDEEIPSSTSSMYSLFQTYYQDQGPNYPDTLITSIMEKTPPYNSATSEQISFLVTGILKYVVSYLAVTSAFAHSIDECYDNNESSSLEFWDTAAMLFIGSMEGEVPNGNEYNGEFLYATSKELCEEFTTCVSVFEGNGDVKSTAANEEIMKALKDAISSITSGECDVAEGLLDESIMPNLLVPLLQGTVKYASHIAALAVGTEDTDLSFGYAFSRAVLPVINQASSASADTIKTQLEFQLTSKPMADGFVSVADALRQALPSMDIACADIGIFEDEQADANLCGDSQPTPTSPVAAPGPQPTAPTPASDLAFGRYTFKSTDVADGDSSFALDVRDMFYAKKVDDAGDVYTNGANALTTGLSGQAGIVSLSSLSLEASRYMGTDPMFSIFKYALYEDTDLEDTSGEDFLYAHDVVEEALNNARDHELAAAASVVMNVWMVIVHQLYSAVQLCKAQDAPEELIDSAVALWIGKEQEEGMFDSGWMMYSLGQEAAKFFGLEEKEAAVNTELMNLFNNAQSLASTCTNNPTAFEDLRKVTSNLIRTLTKPMVLMLLYHMVGTRKNEVELYAVAVVPQCAACNPEASAALQEALFKGYQRDTTLTDELIDHLATFLRCQRITCEDLEYTNIANDDLVDLVDKLCSRLTFNDDDDQLPIAGYIPTTDVSEIARLDLDILEIEIMTRTRAYDAAMDVYRYGHNAKVDGSGMLWTLEGLAKTVDRSRVYQYQLLNEYFDDPNYADTIVLDALNREGDYPSATRGQLVEIVGRTLQSMVTYMGVLVKMELAVYNCGLQQYDLAQSLWDQAVALFVGSMNGPKAGGLIGGGSETMYSLGNEVCADWSVEACEANGESSTNERIMFQFAGGRDAIAEFQCGHLETTMTDEIIPRMAIPLIQGVLTFAMDNEESTSRDPESIATVHTLAEAVVALVKKANEDSASTLDDILGDFQSVSTGQPVDELFDAFTDAYRGMGIDCKEVGKTSRKPDWSACTGTSGGGNNGNDDDDDAFDDDDDAFDDDDASMTPLPETAPLPDTPTNLGNDLYVTSTYVQDKAAIAFDVKDMEEALDEGSYELAKLTYETGKNSEVFDENGKFVSVRSLEGFSVDETLEMLDEPIFNLYKFALQDENGNFMSREVRLYADTLVLDTFAQITHDSRTLPAEAAVALNLWMHVIHLLHKALFLCQNKQLKDEEGVHSTDVAVAYWIGDGQVAGDKDRGHLLYAFAEKMGDLFNINGGGQSRTNSNILRFFNEAKNELSLPGACSENPSSFIRLRRIVNKLESQMAVPLIQALIHYLRLNDRPRVKIYAHAIIPMTASCSPSSFAYLKEKLLKGNYNVIEVESIVEVIRSVYPCLGLSCDDIGVHESETDSDAPKCEDLDVLNSLAGYKPGSDVREYARLDLDVRELDVLLQMEAYKAAQELYLYGRHVNGGSFSLSQVATTSERSIVPEFDSFVRYYGNDNYADEIIRNALDGSLAGGWSKAQRRVIVLKASQVLVTYFGVLQAAYEAVSDCSSSSALRAPGSSESWDKAAAILIGHLEGTETDGTAEGYMYYDLAQEHCKTFGTCLEDNPGVHINDQLIDLLYAGRGAVLANSCTALRKTAKEIASLLLVPMVQGALSTSIKLSSAEIPVERAEAYVYSRGLLPLVDDANRESATKIDKYLGGPAEQQTNGKTSSEVFAALAKVYPKMGIECEMIGKTDDFDACAGVVYNAGMSGTVKWIIITVFIVLCVSFARYFIRLRRVTKNLPENNPRFKEPQGELNHSMDLLEKAFSSKVRTRTSPLSTETAPLHEDMVHDPSPPDNDENDFEDAVALTSRMESLDADII